MSRGSDRSTLTNAGLKVFNPHEPNTPSKKASQFGNSMTTSFMRQGLATPKGPLQSNVTQTPDGQKYKMTTEDAQLIKANIDNLKDIERELITADKYVEFVTNKYKPFAFNLKLYAQDQLMTTAQYVADHIVDSGPFKDNVMWGSHLPGAAKFTPHGFCIFLDKQNKICHVGSFKEGKEFGQ